MIHLIEREQIIARPLKQVFRFFADAHNLEKITPPFLGFKVLTPKPIPMRAGTLIDYKLKLHGLPLKWQSRIEWFKRGEGFMDIQLKGPYTRWEHEHRFVDMGDSTKINDKVLYQLPLDPFSRPIHHLFVKSQLKTIFDYRHSAVELMFPPQKAAA